MTATIVICEPIHDAGLAALRARYTVIEAFRGPAGDMAGTLQQADACIVRALPLSAEMIGHCPRLKVIAKHGVGVDAIDVDAATEHGIVVANTPGTNGLSVAEASVALMFAVHRRLHAQHGLVLNGDFAGKDAMVFRELTGKVLGLVGGGSVGAHIARICGQGFAMQVLLFDPYMDAAAAQAMGAEKAATLDDLLRRSDIVSVQTPLTDATRGMIGAAQLARMKADAILVNVARGGVVEEAALTAALTAGAIAGAGLDTFETEPTPKDNPLLALSNVALTPHSGGSSLEGLERTAAAVARIVIDVLAGRAPDSVVNPEVWEHRRQ